MANKRLFDEIELHEFLGELESSNTVRYPEIIIRLEDFIDDEIKRNLAEYQADIKRIEDQLRHKTIAIEVQTKKSLELTEKLEKEHENFLIVHRDNLKLVHRNKELSDKLKIAVDGLIRIEYTPPEYGGTSVSIAREALQKISEGEK